MSDVSSGTGPDGGLHPEDRRRLTVVADHLFPPTHGMPSVTDVDLAGRLIDQVLRARPDLVEPLIHIVRRPFSSPAVFLDALRRDDPLAFDTLVTAIAAGYYMAPEARQALGYPGQVATEIDRFELPEFLEEGLLDPVIARGPIYRTLEADSGASQEP